MRFLSVGPEICLQLPSDSTSRWTPLLFGYTLPTIWACSGLSPIRARPWRANKRKKVIPKNDFSWWFQAESNRRHKDFQSFALPTELQNQWLRGKDLNQRPPGYGPDELPGCSTSRFDERIWRRSRDSNPGASFPTYRFSRPDPSTTWVLLHSGP